MGPANIFHNLDDVSTQSLQKSTCRHFTAQTLHVIFLKEAVANHIPVVKETLCFKP